ncbi:MASE1 domain-containing protein [Amycolatopsis acididurans]|uniref:MASE1 domain-containing protein n=1 Tax=Amycolatopsis acididurans TaxID=2724524 RepID=UPI001B31FD75|nr:MASE1 domain-containing protein [Amycolatopsis acididurans]
MSISRGYVVTVIVVAVVYYGAALLGLRLALVSGQVSPLWPPTGIALAALLLKGPHIWPAILLGALAANVTLGPSTFALLIIIVGNTIAPVTAYFLLKAVRFDNDLNRLRDVLALVFLGAFTGMLVSSSLGTLALAVAHDQGSSTLATWSVWWTGDAMGVLTVTPLLLVARRIRFPFRVRPARVAEASALFLGTAGVGVFVANTSATLLFLVFPFLIWAALRFQQAGAIPCALTVSTIAIIAASHNSGPFGDTSLTVKMIVLQAFNGCVVLTALVHAAVTAGRNRAQRDVEDACALLADAVNALDRGKPLQGQLLHAVERARRPPRS